MLPLKKNVFFPSSIQFALACYILLVPAGDPNQTPQHAHLYCFSVTLLLFSTLETFHAILYLRFRVLRSFVRFSTSFIINLFFLHSTSATSSLLQPLPPPLSLLFIDLYRCTHQEIIGFQKERSRSSEVVKIFWDPVALYPIIIGFPPPAICFNFPTQRA